MRIHIQAIQFTASEQLIDFIEKKISKLEHFYDRIIDVEVYLTLDNKSSHIKDKVVRIKVNLPRVQLVASERSKLFETATDLSVDSIKRQLKRYKRSNGADCKSVGYAFVGSNPALPPQQSDQTFKFRS